MLGSKALRSQQEWYLFLAALVISSPLKLRAASRPAKSFWLRLASIVESAWVLSLVFSSITLEMRRSAQHT